MLPQRYLAQLRHPRQGSINHLVAGNRRFLQVINHRQIIPGRPAEPALNCPTAHRFSRLPR